MKTSNIINIVLVGFVMYLLLKPKPVSAPYYLREMKASIERQDSLVNLINNLQTPQYEIKDSIIKHDSVYIPLDKPEVRERADNIFNRFNIN